MGKGSRYRPVDRKKWDENWNKIDWTKKQEKREVIDEQKTEEQEEETI